MSAEEDRIARYASGQHHNVAARPATSKFGAGNPKCPRCNKSVYANEKVYAIGKEWHQTCLKCPICNKRLDASSLNEHDSEVYCTPCYQSRFGPKGFGFTSTIHTEGGTGEAPVNASAETPDATPAVVTGEALSPRTPKGRFCSNCGTAASGGNFCSGCGTKL